MEMRSSRLTWKLFPMKCFELGNVNASFPRRYRYAIAMQLPFSEASSFSCPLGRALVRWIRLNASFPAHFESGPNSHIWVLASWGSPHLLVLEDLLFWRRWLPALLLALNKVEVLLELWWLWSLFDLPNGQRQTDGQL